MVDGDCTEKGSLVPVLGEKMEESSDGETIGAGGALLATPDLSSRRIEVAAARVLAAWVKLSRFWSCDPCVV